METMRGRFEQGECFAAVAETGSFTGAAKALGCSKAHVSKQVSALERALGVQLLLRTTRRLHLTEGGQLYLDYCRQAREALTEAERAVSARSREVAGTLRLTAATSFGEAFLLDMLLAFQQRHPGVKVVLDLSLQVRDLVAEGFDFAVRTTRTPDSPLVARALGVLREFPVASPELLARHPPVRAPSELGRLPCIVNTHFRDDPEWLLLRGEETSAVRVQGSLALNHYNLIRAAALRGVGVARLPQYLVQSALAEGRLVRLLPEYEFAPIPVYLVYPQRRHMPHRSRAFRDFALAWFAQASPGNEPG